MANFGFAHLAVVAPFEAHWREAKSAVGAPELLKNARETKTLAEALSDCTLIIGTGTLTHRKPEQPVVPLPSLAPVLAKEFRKGGGLAIVFGPEKHGLTREDLSYCHLLVEIPTDPRQPSMNLGQAVAVCLYELTRVAPEEGGERETAPQQAAAESPNAASGALDRLAEVIEQTMTTAGYSPRTMGAANRHDLRLLLRRIQLTSTDTRRALGVFRRILWRLTRSDQ
jgi:tRNA/rRNA methyltransferase